jgi:hypothetical protein
VQDEVAIPKGVCLVEIAAPEGDYGALRAVFRDSKGRWWQYAKSGWSRPEALNRAGGARVVEVAAPWLVRRADGAVEVKGSLVAPPAPGAVAIGIGAEMDSPFFEGVFEGGGEPRSAAVLWSGGVAQVLDAKSWWPGGARISASVALPAGKSYVSVAQAGPWVGVLDTAGGAWLWRCDAAGGAVTCGKVSPAPAPPRGVRYVELAGYANRLVLRRSDGRLWSMANDRIAYGRDKGVWEGSASAWPRGDPTAVHLGSGPIPTQVIATGAVGGIGPGGFWHVRAVLTPEVPLGWQVVDSSGGYKYGFFALRRIPKKTKLASITRGSTWSYESQGFETRPTKGVPWRIDVTVVSQLPV